MRNLELISFCGDFSVGIKLKKLDDQPGGRKWARSWRKLGTAWTLEVDSERKQSKCVITEECMY